MRLYIFTDNLYFEDNPLFYSYETVFISKTNIFDFSYNKEDLFVIDNVDEEFNNLIFELSKDQAPNLILIYSPKSLDNIRSHISNIKILGEQISKSSIVSNMISLSRQNNLMLRRANHRQLENIIKALFENTNTGFMMTRNNSFEQENEELLYVNNILLNMTKMDKTTFTRESFINLTHNEDESIEEGPYLKLVTGQIKKYDIEKRIVTFDDNLILLSVNAQIISTDADGYSVFLYIINDITKRRLVQDLLSYSEQSNELLMSSFPGVIYRCLNDENWTFKFVSEGFQRLTGYNIEDVLDNKTIPYAKMIVPKYVDYVRKTIDEAVNQYESFDLEYQLRKQDGSIIWVSEKGGAIYDNDGNVTHFEGIILDITKEKTTEEKLVHSLNHHYLTGLYNRSFLEAYIKNMYKFDVSNNSAIFKIRVSFLRDFAKYYGMTYINTILKDIAKTFRENRPEEARVFYSQTNHFVLFIRNIKSKRDLNYHVKKLSKILSKYLSYELIRFDVGVIDLNNYYFSNVNELLKQLLVTIEYGEISQQLYNINYYNDDIINTFNLERDVVTQLEQLIYVENDNNLSLVAQPVLYLKRNKIIGVEMLARLNNPIHGYISPLLFIRLAEQQRLIEDLGRIILEKTFIFMEQLKKEKMDNLLVAVNLSAIQIKNKNFIKDLKHLVKKYKVDSSKLVFELTESVLVTNIELVNQVFKELKKMGIQIAMDDFGAGFSSLYLQTHLNVDVIKLDKSIVEKLSPDNDKIIVDDIISMSHKMGRYVVAEGIETEEQLNYLRGTKCNYGQGYFISKPLKTDAVIEFIKQYNNK